LKPNSFIPSEAIFVSFQLIQCFRGVVTWFKAQRPERPNFLSSVKWLGEMSSDSHARHGAYPLADFTCLDSNTQTITVLFVLVSGCVGTLSYPIHDFRLVYIRLVVLFKVP
jgi:hypothetical protein